MTPYSIFIVDDESSIREGIQMALEPGYRVAGHAAAEPALEAMAADPPDLVLLDIGLPGMDGIKALERMKAARPDLLVIMITAYEDIDSVIAAMRLGAYDYIVKPVHMEALEAAIEKALETIRLKKEVQELQARYLSEHLPCFIGESNAIQDVMEFIERVAKSPDTPVLITGETGTGKELIAAAIHYRSPNFNGPLVTVNCAALPEELVESELFGYERGAFSGAAASGKKGLIETAAGGALFLDEVGDLSPPTQAKLLRFLESGEFFKLGTPTRCRVKTRVISATNKDLEGMIAAGDFRKDLYFRLSVVGVRVPSLNERPADILPLARHFLLEYGRKFGKGLTGFTPAAETAMVAHVWSGNVRELKNRVERGALVGTGPHLTAEDLGLSGRNAPADCPPPASLTDGLPPLTPEGVDLPALQETLERHYFQQALDLAGGNESAAARLLNLNHHTFRYRRKKLRIG